MSTSKRTSSAVRVVVLAASLWVYPCVQAQPVNWLNSADGLWTDATRWSSGMLPGIDNDVVIDALHNDPDSHYIVSGVTGQARSVRIESTAGASMSSGISGAPNQFSISEDLVLNGTGQFFISGGHHQMSVGGNVMIRSEASVFHNAFLGNSTATVTGDVHNDGLLFLRAGGFGRPVSRLEIAGSLSNSASGRVIGGLGTITHILDTEVHNAGLISSYGGVIGREGADHVNTGSILGGSPAFVGNSLTNHGTVAGVLAPDPEDDQQLLDARQIDATGVHVINFGQWFAGLTADTITLEDTSTVRLVLGVLNHPGELLAAADSVLLDGVLDIRWEFLGGGAENLVRDYLLVEAPLIMGSFETILMPSLADGFSASILATDTQVILRVVPAPSAAALLPMFAFVLSARRRHALKGVL